MSGRSATATARMQVAGCQGRSTKLRVLASARAQLIGWSILAVFSQLALVRMFSTIVGATAYYANLFLLVAIFSLAAGFFARRLDKYVVFIPYFLLLSLLTALWLGEFSILNTIAEEFFWVNVTPRHSARSAFDLQLAIMILCFVAMPLLVLIGSRQGGSFVRQHKGHRAYLWMGAGGLIGAVIFVFQNQIMPEFIYLLVLWVILIGVCSWSALESHFQRILGLLPILALLLIGYEYSAASLWSPYQRINLLPVRDSESGPPNGYMVYVNGFYITEVSAVPYRPQAGFARTAFGIASSMNNVLVMGSGGGTSDVREALQAGAGHVEAVEIEPVFIALGRNFDPDKTYESPRVTVVNTDGRKYLAQNRMKFDCVYYPFVDSQTVASNRARFRLDSFLYTVEGLRLAYESLAPEGTLLVYFMTGGASWLQRRMYELLKEATGRHVMVFRLGESHTLYFVRNGTSTASALTAWDIARSFEGLPSLPVPNDDWPFFYSLNKTIPLEHVRLLIIVFLMFLGLLLALTDRSASPGARYRSVALPIYAFFSGAAFFFIELRTISAITPFMGSTYVSQACVVIGIIAASLCGALLGTSRKAVPLYLAWLLLLSGLVIAFCAKSWFHPFSGAVVRSTALYLSSLLVPVFFAGHLYLSYLKNCSPQAALSMQKWNLIGGAVGGLSECVVIVVGFDKTLWIAVLFYCFSCLPFVLTKFPFPTSLRPNRNCTEGTPHAGETESRASPSSKGRG